MTMLELALKGEKRMRRPCWVGDVYVAFSLIENRLPEYGMLNEADRIPLMPFMEFDDFIAI